MKATAALRRSSSTIEPLEARIAPATLFAVTDQNHLLRFDSSTPGTIDLDVAITGLQPNENIHGIDFRPATGQLIALGVENTAGTDTGRLYGIDFATGAATQIGTTPFSTTLTDGASYGFDVNPVADRLRVTNSADQNFRINPTTGAISGVDTALAFAAGDTNFGDNPSVLASAYTNNFAGTPVTTLFGIDTLNDVLVRQGGVDSNPSPNGGVLTTIGALGVDATDASFDIANATGAAFAALTVGGSTGLFTINLTTGAATLVGAVGTGAALHGFSVALPSVKLVNATTATYTDIDGDFVTVKTSKGVLSATDFSFATLATGRAKLTQITLSDDGTEFAGANIAITVKKGPLGDGLANVGRIEATGLDLGTVTIAGDLGVIDVGDANTAATSPALKLLSVRSMGRYGSLTGAALDLTSDINGPLGALKVAGDVKDVFINVSGTIGPVTIGGSLIGGGPPNSGRISSTGDMGAVKIGHDVQGGTGSTSGFIDNGGKLTSITIGGSLIGGAGSNSGGILSGGDMGAVKIGRNVLGGSGGDSGLIRTLGKLTSVTIGGSLIGGAGTNSGEILSSGDMGAVKIGHDVLGGSGFISGLINGFAKVAGVTIGGSLIGGTNSISGQIRSAELGAVKIGFDLVGGSITGVAALDNSGGIVSAGRIASVTIGGSIISGIDTSSGALTSSANIRAGNDLGSLTVKGGIIGNSTSQVVISARGQEFPSSGVDLAIGKISIGSRVEFATILAGYDIFLAALNADAQIGAVKVGGDWVASNLVAGVQNLGADNAVGGSGANADNVNFGDSRDNLIAGGSANIVARIASIAIKGIVIGSTTVADHFGFTAGQIGSFKAGTIAAPLTSAPAADAPFELSLLTADTTIREV